MHGTVCQKRAGLSGLARVAVGLALAGMVDEAWPALRRAERRQAGAVA